MKKVLLTAAIAVFGFTSMNAQNVSFGAKAGMNVATIGGDFGNYYDYYEGDATDNVKSRVGFHVGGLAEIMISEKFAIQPEILYSSQGFKTEYSYGSEREESNVNLSYLNLPVMAKFFPIENLSVEAGPQVGFLLSANEDYEYTDSDFPEDNVSGDRDVKDSVKGVDFSMNIGVGYKLDMGVFFQARYCFGLSEVDDTGYYDDESYYDNYSFSRKNRVFQLSVGYMF
ncbi:porin family protein [Xanthomarina spongicola]|uniref:Outer membrane protein with beta-barrel domain n=1 Tax=Xanthomarina spongicola TaxID=570520 RepID=A0A316DKY3_9FLAO|nr:porin family protein [Xanthomarina spongicola]PWK17383.1 outer membrane protein with beta-barrel domain [Xanthomarina spongicola]